MEVLTSIRGFRPGVAWWLLWAILLGTGIGRADGEISLEYQLKAAFLYQFVKFVEWPAGADNRAVVLGVVGRDPFGDFLDRFLVGKMVNGTIVVVRRFQRAEDVKGCHVAFFSQSEEHRLVQDLKALDGAPTLTVSEVKGFLQSGGMINFILVDNRVRFEINAEAVRRSGLRVSAQLLKLGARSWE